MTTALARPIKYKQVYRARGRNRLFQPLSSPSMSDSSVFGLAQSGQFVPIDVERQLWVLVEYSRMIAMTPPSWAAAKLGAALEHAAANRTHRKAA